MNIWEKSLISRRHSNEKIPEAKRTWGIGRKSKELCFPGQFPQEICERWRLAYKMFIWVHTWDQLVERTGVEGLTQTTQGEF